MFDGRLQSSSSCCQHRSMEQSENNIRNVYYIIHVLVLLHHTKKTHINLLLSSTAGLKVQRVSLMGSIF